MDCPTVAEDSLADASGPLVPSPALVEAVARATVRRHHLPFHEADDLCSALWIKLLDRNARVLERFQGRGSLFVYLFRIARRLVLDQQIARLGRWRPTRHARRLGPAAMAWSRMVERDGVPEGEATSLLCSKRGLHPTDVAALADARPLRRHRASRRFMAVEEGEPSAIASGPNDSPVHRLMRHQARRRVATALRVAFAGLSRDERRLLRLRFHHGLRISDIARREGLRQIDLYREYRRILDKMRQAFGAADVGAGTVDIAISALSAGASTLNNGQHPRTRISAVRRPA